MKKYLVLWFIMIYIIPINGQSIELSDLLKNHKSYTNQTVRAIVNGENLVLSRENRWFTQVKSTTFGSLLSFGNRYEIDTPSKITDYLKAEGFTIDFVTEKRDEFGNLYAYFRFEDSYWKVDFSCGSRGCGLDFQLLP